MLSASQLSDASHEILEADVVSDMMPLSRKISSCSQRWEEVDWSFEKLGSIWSAPCPCLSQGSFTKQLSLTANLVLQDAVERIFVQNLYADIPKGVYLVRGENVLVLGEIV